MHLKSLLYSPLDQARGSLPTGTTLKGLVGRTWSEGETLEHSACFHYGGAKKNNTTVYSLARFFAQMNMLD